MRGAANCLLPDSSTVPVMPFELLSKQSNLAQTISSEPTRVPNRSQPQRSGFLCRRRCILLDALGDETGVLDEVGEVANHARYKDLPSGNLMSFQTSQSASWHGLEASQEYDRHLP